MYLAMTGADKQMMEALGIYPFGNSLTFGRPARSWNPTLFGLFPPHYFFHSRHLHQHPPTVE